MGDPFWRRFSASRDRSSAPTLHSRERTLATEYTGLNTRTATPDLTQTLPTAQRRSRNDLFETDWGWKGHLEERGVRASGDENLGRGVINQKETLEYESAPTHMRQIPSPYPSATGNTSDPPCEATFSNSLGAPIQLQSTSPTPPHHHHRSHLHASDPRQSPLRSRNDTIYNVNHLTITPPRSNTPVSLASAVSAARERSRLDAGVPASTSLYNPSSAPLARNTVHSPLSSTSRNASSRDTAPPPPPRSQHDQEITHEQTIHPRRSVSPSSSSSGSSTSIFSGITSFTDHHAVSPHSERKTRPGDVLTGRTNTEKDSTEHSRYQTTTTTISPAVSPITPVTPDTHFPPSFTSSFSSFPPADEDKTTETMQQQQQVESFSSPFATMMTPTTTAIRTPVGARYMTPSISSGYSPSSEVSLSRASSITIVQSPSTALANITRKAGRLLVPDEEEDDDEHDRRGFDGAVIGKGEGGAEVARLRVDIASRQWLVGYGRYAKVYLGSFKPALRPPPPTTTLTAKTPTMTQANMMSAQTSTGWNLCAAKVFDSDTESISMANKEFAMLGYLQEDLPSTQSRPRMSGCEGAEVNRDGDADGRPYILSRIALVDETIIEPPPLSFTTGTPSDLSRSGSRRASGAVASTCMACESPVSGLPNARTPVPLADPFDTSPLGSHARTVYAAHRRGQASGPRHSRSASETTAILRQLGKNAIAAKSSANTFLFAGGGTDPAPSYRPILLLPFYSNGSMATFLKTREEPIDEELWMSWFEQGLRALRWCKMKGVLHNDIKPANFLLDDEMNLRLGDTGSAMRIDPDHPPHDGIGLGTVSYSSPEIVDPSTERTFSFSSDIFSFGVTMRQCMTGREPYEGLRTVELMYHVRKGNYWEWHSRRDMDLPSPSSANSNRNPISPTAVTHHLARVRATTTTATSPSDRNHSVAQPNDGVRRAESLREPSRNRAVVRRPALARTPSSDIVIRQAISVKTSTGAATGVVEAGGDGIASRDQRETWLRRMVDPDPGKRPEVEDLLHGLEGHRAVYKLGAD